MASVERVVKDESEDIESTDFGSCSDRRVYLKETLHFLRLTWPLLLGNTLEWYEFRVYSYVEEEIAKNFFDGSSLGAWLGYAVTFVARPLGGIILGIIADHYGRKISVNLSLGGMIVATVAQGCLPGRYFGGKFQGLGFVLLMIFRALQGLSAGGEIGAVTAYLMEVSPVQTLGMAVCMISIGGQTAWAFASALLAVLNQVLGSEAMLVWGWRIPFLFSALPGALAMWGRNRIQETDVFLSEVRNDEGHKQHVCKSIMELLIHYPLAILIGILGVCCTATMWFAPPFWSINAVLGHLAASDALWVGLCCQLVGLAVTPVAGWCTDRYGVAMTTCVGGMYTILVGFTAYLMLVVDSSRATAYLGVGLFFGLAQGFNGATIYLFCAELFPARLRCQGIALSYNIGVSFLGGFAAAISQALYQLNSLFPGIYWTCTGIVTVVNIFVALRYVEDRRNQADGPMAWAPKGSILCMTARCLPFNDILISAAGAGDATVLLGKCTEPMVTGDQDDPTCKVVK